MVLLERSLTPPNDESFFLLGARGVGRSTLIKSYFPSAYTINLLLASHEERFVSDPDRLVQEVLALDQEVTHVFIDEIQKVPKLCDVVHYLLEEKKVAKRFILTGSSARKLKAAGANLLAGRAHYLSLFPLSERELGPRFSIEKALNYGLLPDVWNRTQAQSIVRYLRGYCQTYLKEEVWAEHLIRKIEPFRKFLEVAAQHNTRIVNYTKIAKIIGVDPKTVQTYFQILEETYLAILLEPYARSIRQQVHAAPRFYFIDTGIARALARQLTVAAQPQTAEYGYLFEQFIVTECIKRNSYEERDYKFSYLTTKAGAEIDLIIERPGKQTILLEIKSSTQSLPDHGRHLAGFRGDFDDPIGMVASQDPIRRRKDWILFAHWQEALAIIFD